MPTHPRRARRPTGPHYPTAGEVRAARTAAGLTQTAAAALVHTTCRVWQQWEAGDRRMHPAFWDLFHAKAPRVWHPGLDDLPVNGPR